MAFEIEKRFKNYDYKALKNSLKASGFEKVGTFLFKFISYKGTKDGQSIRIRDEGNKTTFTVKQKNKNYYDNEYEVIVSSFDTMKKILSEISIPKKYELHKIREIYNKDDVEVIFDHHPGLRHYVEVEAKTEKALSNAMKVLGLEEEPSFSASDLYFEEYGISKSRPEEDLTFENVTTLFDNMITKNNIRFTYLLNKQNKKINKITTSHS